MDTCFISLEKIPKDSFVVVWNYMFNFILKNYQTLFQNWMDHFAFRPAMYETFIVPYPCHYLVLSDFVFFFSGFLKWYSFFH